MEIDEWIGITTPKGEKIDVNINTEDDADDDEIRIVFYDIKTFPDGMEQTGDQFDMITIKKQDTNKPRKFTIEFTTKTNADVVELDFKKIKKFIKETVGNITEETTMFSEEKKQNKFINNEGKFDMSKCINTNAIDKLNNKDLEKALKILNKIK